MKTMPSRQGFTLLELLVVIAVIIILASMVMAILAILRKTAHKAATMDQMTNIYEGVTKYMESWPRLGDVANGTDFRNDPWEYLYKRQHRGNVSPIVEFSFSRLVRKTGPGTCDPVKKPMDGTHIVDHFGNNPDNVLSWTIRTNQKGGGPLFAQAIMLRSSLGTPTVPTDDIIYLYTADTSMWTLVKPAELTDIQTRMTTAGQALTTSLSEFWEPPLEP